MHLSLWTQNCTNSYGVPFNFLHQVILTFKCQTAKKNSKTGSRNVQVIGIILATTFSFLGLIYVLD